MPLCDQRQRAEDSSFNSGTTRNKLDPGKRSNPLISPNVLALTSRVGWVHSIGVAIEVAHEKTVEFENDDEKSRLQHMVMPPRKHEARGGLG